MRRPRGAGPLAGLLLANHWPVAMSPSPRERFDLLAMDLEALGYERGKPPELIEHGPECVGFSRPWVRPHG